MNDYKLQYLRLEICDDIKFPIRSKNGTNICYNPIVNRNDFSLLLTDAVKYMIAAGKLLKML